MKPRFYKVLNCTKCGDSAVILHGKCISIKSGKVCGGKPIYVEKNNYLPFEKWTAKEYDQAIDAICREMYLSEDQKSRIRYAIRKEVET